MQALMQNVDKIKDYNFDMDKRFHGHTSVVQKMNNKLVTLERQQAQGNRPFQSHYQNPTFNRLPNLGQGTWTQNRLEEMNLLQVQIKIH